MHWSIYVVIGIAAAVIIYLVFGLCLYCRVFGRLDDPYLDEVDLTHTHYGPYKEKLFREMDIMRSRKYREVNCVAQDGITLSGDYYDNGGEKLALLVHGYRSRPLNNFSVSGNSLFGRGYDLLMIHQRGFGRSGGRFTTMGVKEQRDVLAWIDWVKKNTKIKSIILYGVSMGCYTVSCISDKADENFVKAIIADCGFSSPYDELKFCMKNNKIFYPPLMPLFVLYARIISHISLKGRAAEPLSAAKIPVMFIHGKKDGDVPCSCSEENYLACASPKDICLVEDAGHTACFLVDAAKVEKYLYEFLKKYI